jgi:CBS domain containing-hemolysin-like protein
MVTVVGLSPAWMLAIGLPALALYLISMALLQALRSYSRGLLQERCARRGRLDRAEAVARLGRRTERGALGLALWTGLVLATLVGLAGGQAGFGSRLEILLFSIVTIGLLGQAIAGTIGGVFAETIIDALWPAAGFLRAAAAPITFGLRQAERLIERLAGRRRPAPRPARLEVEVPRAVDAGADQEPELPGRARVLMQQAFALTRADVAAIMTPRSAMVWLPSSVSAEGAAATFRETGRSRIPLFGANREEVVGILYAKDLFARTAERQDLRAIRPRELVRPAYFVPESKNAFELVDELRNQRKQIAIVLDEYGSVAGLVTLEDLLEELVGPIDDEHDVPTPADPIRKLGGSRYEVDATLALEELNDRLGLRLPTDLEFLTVGGLAFYALGRVPVSGDSFQAFGAAFTVVEVSDHTIKRLQIELPGQAAAQDAVETPIVRTSDEVV